MKIYQRDFKTVLSWQNKGEKSCKIGQLRLSSQRNEKKKSDLK